MHVPERFQKALTRLHHSLPAGALEYERLEVPRLSLTSVGFTDQIKVLNACLPFVGETRPWPLFPPPDGRSFRRLREKNARLLGIDVDKVRAAESCDLRPRFPRHRIGPGRIGPTLSHLITVLGEGGMCRFSALFAKCDRHGPARGELNER